MLLSKDDLELHANNMELPLRLLILRTSRPPGLPLRARAFLCRFRSGVLYGETMSFYGGIPSHDRLGASKASYEN